MNDMNKSERRKRNVLIWTALILILLIVCLILFDVLFRNRKNGETTTQSLSEVTSINEKPMVKPALTESSSDLTITLKDYLVFDLEGIDFRFIIAKLHIAADDPTNIPLSHFTTSENIRLDETDSYVKTLEEHSLYLGRQNVWFSLISEENEYDANIFIPVQNEAATVSLSCDLGNNGNLTFSLIPANGKESMLQYEADDVITDGKTYQMRVSKAYDITGLPLYQNTGNEEIEYLLPSTTKVYAFEVKAVSLYGDTVTVESAQYIPTSSAEVFEALGSDIRSMKYDNMIGIPVNEQTTGYLLFYAYDPDTSPVTYQGVLKVKLSGVDIPVTVNVDLNHQEGNG